MLCSWREEYGSCPALSDRLPRRVHQGAGASALLEKLFLRPLRFSEDDFARSLSNLGTGSRLRLVMDKLMKGASWLESMWALLSAPAPAHTAGLPAARGLVPALLTLRGRAGLPITAVVLGGSIEVGADLRTLYDDAYFVRPSLLCLDAQTMAVPLRRSAWQQGSGELALNKRPSLGRLQLQSG